MIVEFPVLAEPERWKFGFHQRKQMLDLYHHKAIRKKIISGILLLGMVSGIHAQDHYWGQQYGGHATLTGGTAVVGVNDHSCIYYNPGALSFLDTVRVTASTFAGGFEVIRMKNGAGDGLQLNSTRANILPQLLAGTINIPKVPRLKLVYGLLTRSRTNIRLSQENEMMYDVIPAAPGSERYKALGDYTYSSVEQWSGLGLAYKIGKNWAVGVSSFGSYLNLDVKVIENAQVEAVSNGVPYIATVNEYSSVLINQVTQVFKVGVAMRSKRIQVGAAVTLPGIRIWGEGRMSKSFEAYNMNQYPTDTTIPAQRHPSLVIADLQRGLKSRYRIPFSASAGLKIHFPKFSLSASLEYFMGFKNRNILNGEDRAVYRPVPLYGGDTIPGFMQLQTGARAVINAGIGAEIKFKTNMAVLLGLRTDFSNRTNYLPDNAAIQVSYIRPPSWDYVYLSAGFTYRLSMHLLTIGFDYGIGFAALQPQLFNLTEPQHQTFLRGDLNPNMKTSVHRFNVLMSYIYFFKPKEKRGGPLMMIREMDHEIKRTVPSKSKKKKR